MTRFLTGAPIWVWPLLLLLIVVGLRARRDREVPVVLIYLLPLLGILPLRATIALPAAGWIWAVFAAGYLAGGWIGHRMQGGWMLGRNGARVRVKGESLTLLVVMLVFWANFVGGLLQAVAADVYASAIFHLVFVTIIALSAGSFAGRGLRVWRTARD
jgi:hypothetical protein